MALVVAGVAVGDCWVVGARRIIAFKDRQEPTEPCLGADLVDELLVGFDPALFLDEGLMAAHQVTIDRDGVDRVDQHGCDVILAEHGGFLT